MRSILILSALLTAGSVAVGLEAPGAGTDIASSCAPADEKSAEMMAYLRNLLTNPELARFREAIKLEASGTTALDLVTADSVCAKAGPLMNQVRHLPDSTTHRVHMVRIGRQYWAEDGFHAGEWIQALVLDSTLTRVLSTPGR